MVTAWTIDEPLLEGELRRVQLILVRHGESGWNSEGRIQGQLGGGLTDRGRSQAEETAAHLAQRYPEPAAVYSSDLERVVQTARPYADSTGVAPTFDERWREIDNGRWSGQPFAQVLAEDADLVAQIRAGADLPRGGGERMADLLARVQKALAASAAAAAGRPGPLVVFTHGGPIRVAALDALGTGVAGIQSLRGAANCSLTEIELVLDASGTLVHSRLISYSSAHHVSAGPSGPGAD